MKKGLIFGLLLILMCFGVCTYAEDLDIELSSVKSDSSYLVSIDFPQKTNIAVMSFEISYDSEQFAISDIKGEGVSDEAMLQINEAYEKNKAKISFMSLEPITDTFRFTFLLTPKNKNCESEVKLENIQMADIDEKKLSAVSNSITVTHKSEVISDENKDGNSHHYSGAGSGSSKKNDNIQDKNETEPLDSETSPILQQQIKFSDLDGFTWAETQIKYLADKNIIKGTGENSFSPAQNIKRGDFICLLVRMLGLEAKGEDNFSDVYENEYWYNEIKAAKENKIAYGSEGKFNPGDYITREDMFTLTARAMNYTGGNKSGYVDYENISEYARDGINSMTAKGLIQGNNGLIEPKKTATRAETAVMLYNIYNYNGGNTDE